MAVPHAKNRIKVCQQLPANIQNCKKSSRTEKEMCCFSTVDYATSYGFLFHREFRAKNLPKLDHAP
jgi:hypothetical protein